MIGEYPITWLAAEVISVALFTLCLLHALKQADARHRVLELVCFVIGAGIFEHVGVLTGNYSYDQHRILMAGLVPLSVLLLEAEILYASFTLFEHLNMPKWTAIWVVGFFCAFQDMSIDPVYVRDAYSSGGTPSGQWNWADFAGGTLFGIPNFNFSGWLYMTGFYAAMILAGRWLYKKRGSEAFGDLYPFLAGLLLMVPLAVVGNVLIKFAPHRAAEQAVLLLNCLLPIALMIAFRKRMTPLDLKKDAVVFIVPIVLRLYDLALAFGLRLTEAYIPVFLCSALHGAYLFYLYRVAKKAGAEPERAKS